MARADYLYCKGCGEKITYSPDSWDSRDEAYCVPCFSGARQLALREVRDAWIKAAECGSDLGPANSSWFIANLRNGLEKIGVFEVEE